jgi:hypothetical protein
MGCLKSGGYSWHCNSWGSSTSAVLVLLSLTCMHLQVHARTLRSTANPDSSTLSVNAEVFGDPNKVKYFVEPLPAEIEQVCSSQQQEQL